MSAQKEKRDAQAVARPSNVVRYIEQLTDGDERKRGQAAQYLFSEGTGRIAHWIVQFQNDDELGKLIVTEQIERPSGDGLPHPKLTVGIAVASDTFEKIRASNGSPALADAPSDQDVLEFELEFTGDFVATPRLDVLTTNAPGGNGAIARFLEKFGPGIQQVEMDVKDVDRATEILRAKFKIEPIYPATRAGADGTRVNFFLVSIANEKKVLLELVEHKAL